MNNENCEPRIRFTAQRGRQGFELILPRLHVFLAHTHPGGVGGERLLHWSTYFGHKISKIRCQKIK